MVFECAKCKKTFKALSWLKRHEQRKTPCVPTLERQDAPDHDTPKNRCKHCNRDYSSKKTLNEHIRLACKVAVRNTTVADNTNPGAGAASQSDGKAMTDLVAKLVDMLDTQNVRMLALIEQKLQIPTARPNTAAISTTVETVAVTNTTLAAGEVGLMQCDYNNIATDKRITFNIFGKESLTHATDARIKTILDDSLSSTASIPAAAQMAVTKTAMLIYSDPDHPENLTCYLPNKKTNDALVHTAQGWEIQPISIVIATIGQVTIDHIFAKQPHENADHYTLIMRELMKNEQSYISDSLIRPILVRNRSLLGDAPPTAGMP